MRRAEKQRTSTCAFADRIAKLSIDHYRTCVPLEYQQQQRQICLSTIVLQREDRLEVVAMGVGNKFLMEKELARRENAEVEEPLFGSRVRDCHAEVLARRAFRRYVSERILAGDRTFLGSKIHFYSSSAPCGNATLKKFATFQSETFREELGEQGWPLEAHPPIPGHSQDLGEFSLLLKKDALAPVSHSVNPDHSLPKKKRRWQIQHSLNWCPPGTTTTWAGNGSIHCCSDKILRWNILGLQGSLLSSLLPHPLYISTVTIGRKFSNICVRRAICCRAFSHSFSNPPYKLNHPSVMGTSVCLDEQVINTESSEHGRQASFGSECWVWYHSNTSSLSAELIDGDSGLAVDEMGQPSLSCVSTRSLNCIFMKCYSSVGKVLESVPDSIDELKVMKQQISTDYEYVKEKAKQTVLRGWKSR